MLFQLSYTLNIYENKIAIKTNNTINNKYTANKAIGIQIGQNTHNQDNANTPVSLRIASIIVNVVAEIDIFMVDKLLYIYKLIMLQSLNILIYRTLDFLIDIY